MNERTKKVLAALLPLAVLGIWTPQLLRGEPAPEDAAGDLATESGYDDPAGGWFEDEEERAGERPVALDVLDLGAAGTLERIDRLERVLSGSTLFRAPDPARERRLVEALELAVAEVGVAPFGAGEDDGSAQGPPVAATDVRDPAGVLAVWARQRTVGGLVRSGAVARCLVDGRVLAVGDTFEPVPGLDTPPVVEAIGAEGVTVRAGDVHARLPLAPTARASTGPRTATPRPEAYDDASPTTADDELDPETPDLHDPEAAPEDFPR